MEKEEMQILVTLDENYLEPLKVMLFSIALNHPQEKITFWLIHKAIPEKKLTALEAFIKQFNCELETLQVEADLFNAAPITPRYPQEMYYRLLCPFILPKNLKKVLYIDPDTLVINSLQPLWQQPLADKMFAAANHTGMINLSNDVNRLRLGTDHVYFNSGVLLIDLEKGRKIIRKETVFNYIEERKNILILPDQDVLNALYGKYILEIPEELWNYDTRNYASYYTHSLSQQDYKWVLENTAILHFCGKPKPWNTNSGNRFHFLYNHYQKLLKKYCQ